jgi:hypothetical protein
MSTQTKTNINWVGWTYALMNHRLGKQVSSQGFDGHQAPKSIRENGRNHFPFSI